MGLIREPKNIDLVVAPSILTNEDKQMISKIIADYKRTKKTPTLSESKRLRVRKSILRRTERVLS
ncbi:MAG: hypothetical protein KGZ58_02180 [Ignavibacteriales bacterium]|nr:hypothetical protein [Ignavibacteriales bacterium]